MKYDFDHVPDHRKNGSYRWGQSFMPHDVIGMGTADLDFCCAPCIREALLPVAEENCFNYRQMPGGYLPSLKDWYRRKYGLAVRDEWVSHIPGTIGAIRMALGTFATPGDTVIVQTPVFGPIPKAAEAAGLRVLENPMKAVNRHYEIDFEDFENKIKTYRPSIYVMVNPHNPTGRVFTEEELLRLVKICAEYGVTIISDEVHSLIIYEGNVFTPLLAVSEKAKICGVQIMSFSKGYNIMGLPHAVIMIADPLLRASWERKEYLAGDFDYSVNAFSAAAVTSILKGEADEWMAVLNKYLRRNLEELLAFIERHHLPIIPYKPEGSFLLWADCRNAGIGDADLGTLFLEQAHIQLDDGEKCFGKDGKGFVRINFAVTNKVLHEALERMRRVFD